MPQVTAGNTWNEIEAATKLYQMRQEQQHFTGLSFETISAFGPNGAVIHYRPQPDTNRLITTESLYLVDSGGQYKGETGWLTGKEGRSYRGRQREKEGGMEGGKKEG